MDKKDPLHGLVATRPRLMADAAAIARVKAAVAASSKGAKILDQVIKQANEIEHQPYLEPDFLKPGHKPTIRLSLDHLSTARTALNRLQTLGMAWLMTGNARYVARARNEIKTICEFPAWQDPNHFLDTAEMTNAAAIGYDWFYAELSADERRTLAQAIIDKGLKPGLQQLTGTPDPAWPTRVTNWNLVCNGGLMLGALALAEPGGTGEIDAGLTRKVFSLCLKSVATGFRGYAPEGTWDEGPGYWTYATEYVAYLLPAMTTALGHDFDLGNSPGLDVTGLYRLAAEGPPMSTSSVAGLLFNYSDSPETHSGTWCLRWLAQRYKKPVLNWVAFQRKKGEAMDLLWFYPDEPPPNAAGVPPDAKLLGTAELAMLRGNWDDRATWQAWKAPETTQDLDTTYVAVRAGRNTAENHHGHLDLGSFVLDSNAVRWAVDIPPVADPPPGCVADYDLPGYFDLTNGQRFTYYRTSTIGHNTLLVNGANQALEVQAKIIAFSSTPDLSATVVDLTPAYPNCISVRRGFALIRRQHVLIVDEITTRGVLPVSWQMHTRAGITLDSHAARLHHEDAPNPTKELFLQILDPAPAAFTLEPMQIAPPQAPNTGIRKLALHVADASRPTRIAVYISPKREPFAQIPPVLTGPLAGWGQAPLSA